ncbi:MAG: oxygen-independent coproporphyrinogen III oxidase [Alphaproteobacteria bacterium]|nr:oxygen-independent coproporphyrinogen III oxidase [Alphaproteobacteria bacterium]
MLERQRQYLDRQVPRYTSYPTAPHFNDRVDGATYESWLYQTPTTASLSLYLHVPFCAEMCWYCGCHTKIARRYAPIADYATTLGDEIDLVASRLPARMEVVSVHWGGGTPTMLSERDFAALIARIGKGFALGSTTEIAVEVDPRTLTVDMARALGTAGVTRASLGVQDFNDEVQRAINRVQPFAVTAEAVENLRRNGVGRINFDLMYGLPRQDVDGVIRTVDRAVELAPDRIALFGYAHVPWMKRHQRLIDTAALADGPGRLAQLDAATRRLATHGYRRVGLDHFARAGDSMSEALADGRLKRNFQGYTVDPASVFLGFGASAIGSLAQGYVQNAVPIKTYRDAVADGRLPVAGGIAIDADDRLRREVIERLMCDSAVDLDESIRLHSVESSYFDAELETLQEFARDGLVHMDGRRIALTEAGRPFVRNVAAVFDRYLESGRGRHSRAV